MTVVPRLLVGLVAALQLGIAAAELFLWEGPELAGVRRGLDLDRRSEADKVAPIMVNVGLYTVFVAVGLVWGLILNERPARTTALFLGFAAVAGVFAAVTIPGLGAMLLLQTLPAAAALAATWAAGGLSRPPAAADPGGAIPLGEPDAADGAAQVDARDAEADGDDEDAGPSSAVYIHTVEPPAPDRAGDDNTPAPAGEPAAEPGAGAHPPAEPVTVGHATPEHAAAEPAAPRAE